MRVLSVLVSDSTGGAEYAAVDLLDALERRGVSSRLLTNQPELVRGTRVSAIPLDLGPKLNRASVVRNGVSAPLLWRRLRRALEAETFDVSLFHFKKEQFLAAALPRDVTGPVVWAEWGPLPQQLRHGPARGAYAAAARRPAAVLAESDTTAQSLFEAGVAPEKTAVIGNVFDGDQLEPDAGGRERFRARLGAGDAAFVVGCVSRFHATKPLGVVIAAMQRLPEDVQLVLAGSGDDEAALRAQAAPYGRRVQFVSTPRGHLAELVSAFDVQVYAPSVSEGSARGVTMAQLIARPVVATAVEGTQGLLAPGTGTVVAPANDPRALADCLLEYRADRGRCRREGEAGRRAALERLALIDPVGSALRALEAAAGSRAPI